MLPADPFLLLRATWWATVVALVVQVVIRPSFLADPSTTVGGDAFSTEIHWIPAALFAWLVVGGRLIASQRMTTPRSHPVIEMGKGARHGPGVLMLLVMVMLGTLLVVSGLARAMAALLT